MEKIDYINWWEATQEDNLDEIKMVFKDLFSGADFLPSIYHPILYKYFKNTQMRRWDRDIFTFTNNKIQEIKSLLGTEEMENTLLANIHYLIDAYENLLDLEERIILMNRFKGDEEVRAKNFSINIYNDLLNLNNS